MKHLMIFLHHALKKELDKPNPDLSFLSELAVITRFLLVNSDNFLKIIARDRIQSEHSSRMNTIFEMISAEARSRNGNHIAFEITLVLIELNNMCAEATEIYIEN